MKTLIFSFLLFSLTVIAQNNPVAGENFNLVYDPFENGVFGGDALPSPQASLMAILSKGIGAG